MLKAPVNRPILNKRLLSEEYRFADTSNRPGCVFVISTLFASGSLFMQGV